MKPVRLSMCARCERALLTQKIMHNKDTNSIQWYHFKQPSPEYINLLDLISAWVGSIYMSLSYMFGAAVPRLTARFGFRITAIGGSLLLAISICASSFVDNVWLFFVLFSILSGLGSGVSYHCSILVVLRHFDSSNGAPWWLA